MKENINELQVGLKKFGLNPDHWRLDWLSEGEYQITHLQDQDFYFHGLLEQKPNTYSYEWKKIELQSI